MELGRGPKFEKDSNDLADLLASGCVKAALFVILAIVGAFLLIGIFR